MQVLSATILNLSPVENLMHLLQHGEFSHPRSHLGVGVDGRMQIAAYPAPRSDISPAVAAALASIVRCCLGFLQPGVGHRGGHGLLSEGGAQRMAAATTSWQLSRYPSGREWLFMEQTLC